MKKYNQYLNELLSEQSSGKEQLKAIEDYSMDWTYEYSDDNRSYTAGEQQRRNLQYMINDLVKKIRSGEVTDVKIEEVEAVVEILNKHFMGSSSVSVPALPRDTNKEAFDQIKKIWPINGAKAEELKKTVKHNTFAIKKAGSNNEFLFLPKANQGEVVWKPVERENSMYAFRNPIPRIFLYVDNAGLNDEDFEIVSSKIEHN